MERTKIIVHLLGYVGAVLSATTAQAREPRVDFERVRLTDQVQDSGVTRACAIGYRNLKAYFDGHGVVFDSGIVTSHKLRYCHLYYEPTIKGFRSDASDDPVTDVFYDVASAEAATWAETFRQQSDTAVSLIPVTRMTMNDQHWRSALVSGQLDGSRYLLGAKLDLGPANTNLPQAAAVRSVRSKLSWNAADLIVARDPRDPGRTILFYGDDVRHALGHIRDEERAYLLRVEFGVDAALPLVVPTRQLSDVVVPTPGGTFLLMPYAGKQHILSNFVQRLKKAGFRSSPAGNTIGAPLPDRIVLIRRQSTH